MCPFISVLVSQSRRTPCGKELYREEAGDPGNQRGRCQRPAEPGNRRIKVGNNQSEKKTCIGDTRGKATNAKKMLQPIYPPQLQSQIIVVIV
jgi:hypothetical protein